MSSQIPYTKYQALKSDVDVIIDAYFENGQAWQALIGNDLKLAQAIELMSKSVKDRGKVDAEKGDSKHKHWTSTEAEVLNALNQQAEANKLQKQVVGQQQNAWSNKKFHDQKNLIKTKEAYPELADAVKMPKGTTTSAPTPTSYANAASNIYGSK